MSSVDAYISSAVTFIEDGNQKAQIYALCAIARAIQELKNDDKSSDEQGA